MIENGVGSIVRTLSEARGKNFFKTIVLGLSRVIKADFTYVARLDSNFQTATTIALAIDGEIVDNISYELQHSPCEDVADDKVCIHPSGIQAIYPRDQLLVEMGIEGYAGTPLFNDEGNVIGIVIALYRKPMVNPREVEALFLLFSGMIGGELEKRNQSRQLRLVKRALDTSHDGVIISDLDKKITYVNAAFEKMSGYRSSEVIGELTSMLRSGRHDERFYQEAWKQIDANGIWAGEVSNKKKDGSYYPVWLTISAVTDINGGVTHYAAIAQDITEQRHSEQKIHFQATHDLLTHLPNRLLFSELTDKEIAKAERDGSHFAVVSLDLDVFKMVNDSLGHQTGDQLLCKVAQRMAKHIREYDVLARIDGDQFVLLLRDLCSVDELSQFSRHLLQQLRKPFMLDGSPWEVTASIGVTLYPGDGETTAELLAHSEQAMYIVKKSGRDDYAFFNLNMQQELESRLQLKTELLQAIEQHDFEMYYQPIIEVSSGKIEKCEALIRWQNTRGEWISPATFIPVAEEFGYIGRIGQQVLEMSCRDLKECHNRGFDRLNFTVNRSVQEFTSGKGGGEQWLDIIEQHGLPSDAIGFEITESLLAPENEAYLEVLESLKNGDVQILIDDFGTGYSSLSYLQRFPVDILKIDRAFINPLTRKPKDNMLVASIIAMAKALDMKVVAEGVETAEQYRVLTDMGCDFVQGYYIARPMSLSSLHSFLEKRAATAAGSISADEELRIMS